MSAWLLPDSDAEKLRRSMVTTAANYYQTTASFTEVSNSTISAIAGAFAKAKPNPTDVWGLGTVCIIVITLSSAVGIAILPFLTKRTYERVLTFFIGLGVSSLTGAAIFYLIPETFVPDIHQNKRYLVKAWMIIIGFYLFFTIGHTSKFIGAYLRLRRKQKSQRNGALRKNEKSQQHFGEVAEDVEDIDETADEQQHLSKSKAQLAEEEEIQLRQEALKRSQTPVFLGFEPNETELTEIPAARNGHSNGAIANSKQNVALLINGEAIRPAADDDQSHDEGNVFLRPERSLSPSWVSISTSTGGLDHLDPHSGGHHHHHHGARTYPGQKISSVAWMVIFGDALHKFVDGLTIGSGFSLSINSGLSISLAIVCEEFAHKLGEVAILFNSGMKWQQALFYTLIAGVPLYAGFAVAILADGLVNTSHYVIPLASGIFLYVALAVLIPEMNDKIADALKIGFYASVEIFTLQILGITIGLVITYFTALYGSEIKLPPL